METSYQLMHNWSGLPLRPIGHPTSTVQQINTLPGQSGATNVESSDTTSLLMTIPSPQSSVCLLKTAVATVTNGSNITKENVLFDEGSQRSFIIQDLARNLAL